MQQDWQPSCSLELLRLRAELLHDIRRFFHGRSVLEVETPLLGDCTGTDPQLAFFSTEFCRTPLQQRLFLQTSPEFAMKRLLAAGSGSIYQICKAFRNGESGRFHNPEFTLLEWYRVGFTLPQLMDEIEALFAGLFNGYGLQAARRMSYQAVFQQHTGLDPLQFCHQDYCAYAVANGLPEAVGLCTDNHLLWLDFIFSHKVQPLLGDNALCMVYGYPACQSSLARISADNPDTVDRLELFINGIELGNGFYELTDADEQDRRFTKEIQVRQEQSLAPVFKDQRLLAALAAGLPDCSGIAIGLDRLLMVLGHAKAISETLSFSIDRA
ncbi:MAG: EF-P lysine aminoacylase EpmA [Methylovulum sp.]|uniref:EF-P lysine aminoacylase EpmA n=1 Tax=Methylovulum sp. TaxID=1916980 RepID=UPI00263299F3|nr:EF-P lysine aminoacylase EpmA [Methylovulum sp.]MDD2724621.1 EF-P lysine aminoacylase EpmA [Methylovulum sp.]MDD5126372.1 EF-P lysine aminoacylase EpmA [Methylovulum sp.]